MRVKATRRYQTIVEYILIIAVVVVAAVGVLSIFSDTVRHKISGIVHVLDSGADADAASGAVDTSSEEILKQLDKDGVGSGS